MPDDKKRRNDDKSGIERFIRFLSEPNVVDEAIMGAGERIAGRDPLSLLHRASKPNRVDQAVRDAGSSIHGKDPINFILNNAGTTAMSGIDWAFLPPDERAQSSPPSPERVHPGVPMPGDLGARHDTAGMMTLMEQILGGQTTPARSPQTSGESGPEAQSRYQQFQQEQGYRPEDQEIGYSVDPREDDPDNTQLPVVRQDVIDGETKPDDVLELLDALEAAGHRPSIQDPNTGWVLDRTQIRALMEGEGSQTTSYLPNIPGHRESVLQPAFDQLLQQYNEAQGQVGMPANNLATVEDIQQMAQRNAASSGDRYAGFDGQEPQEPREDDVVLPETYQNQTNAFSGTPIPAPDDHLLSIVSELPRDVNEWRTEDKNIVLNSALMNLDPTTRMEITEAIGEDELIGDILQIWGELIAAGSQE